MTSSAPAICGTRAGCTKLTASIRRSPAAASASMYATRAATSSTASSFCSPSRGPTSTISSALIPSIMSCTLYAIKQAVPLCLLPLSTTSR